MSDYVVIDGEMNLNNQIDGEPEVILKDVARNYNVLANRPKINGTTLEGNQTLSELGLMDELEDTLDDIGTAISGKVDKETGKGLSTNDYTNEEKAKLNGIEAGAEVNVQSDWNAESGDAFIRNKPSIPSKTSDLTNDSGFLTQETDPTVPSWAKQPTKPAYTAQEVGAMPAGTSIPSKTSDLTNDSGFVNSTQAASAAPVQSVNGQTGDVTTPTYTAGAGISITNGVISVNYPDGDNIGYGGNE